jgi:two-component system cell cycle sensor histidine kinase/response regulator CckA
MSKAIHILMLEDRPADAELAMRELRREEIPFTAKRVWTEADFLAELRNRAPDLILADNTLPGYDGLSALKLARRERPAVPFLFVSGTLGEERAIDALHHGATDYVLKQRLGRLGPAVRRALREIQERTQRQQADESLRVSEERFRSVWDRSIDGMRLTDREGRILAVNEAFCRLVKLPPEKLVGEVFSAAYQGHGPDEGIEVYQRRFDAEAIESRVATRTQLWNSEEVDVEISSSFIELGRQGKALLSIFRDITEKRKIEAQLLRNQRIESVGRLTSGIAHDLNNILAPILMCAPLLRDEFHDPESLKMVDMIEASAQRGAAIIKQLLTFGRGTAGERVAVQFLSLMRDMVNIIRETFPKNITTRREAPPGVWLVSGDATQLHQVLLNLCVNARDAMPEGGTLTLELENVQIDETLARMNPDASPGRYVVLSVTDTGTGIPPENLDKVFDPFFTTKELGKGTGLGLSTVIGIVKSHRGFATLNSKVSRGTQFRVYLPACEAPPDAGPPLKPESLPHGQGELVLIVDDEESVRRVARQLLERQGYRVLEAADGTEGLKQYAQHQAEIELVMADLAMPFMDGPAFIRALRQTSPQARIVAMSGLQSVSKIPKGLTEPVQAFLAKPFGSASLLQTVWRALHPETSGQSNATKSSP